MKSSLTRKLLSLLLCAVMLMALAACGGEAADTKGDTKDDAPATGNVNTDAPVAELDPEIEYIERNGVKVPTSLPEGVSDEVVIAVQDDPGSLDPILHSSGFHDTYRMFYERLIEYGYRGEELQMTLATGLEWKSDTELVLTLREGVTFSNGNPFTAEDVLFSIELCANSTELKSRMKNFDLEKSEAIDEHTVKVVLTQYTAEVLYNLVCVPIYDAESYDEVKAGMEPVGTGPYILDEYVPNSHVIAHAREDWWGGYIPMKKVTMKVIAESSQKTNAYESNEIDILQHTPAVDSAYLGTLDGTQQFTFGTGSSYCIWFNLSGESIMDDINARKAVIKALDREAIVNVAFGPGYELPRAIVSHYVPDFNEEWAEAVSDLYGKRDLEEAKKLADESGLSGQTLRVITDGNTYMVAAAEVIQSCLKDIGVSIEITNFDNATFNEKSRDYTTWDFFLRDSVNSTGQAWGYTTKMITANRIGWNGPEYDAMNETANKLTSIRDDAERAELLDDFLIELEELCGVFNIAAASSTLTAREGLANIDFWGTEDPYPANMYWTW